MFKNLLLLLLTSYFFCSLSSASENEFAKNKVLFTSAKLNAEDKKITIKNYDYGVLFAQEDFNQNNKVDECSLIVKVSARSKIKYSDYLGSMGRRFTGFEMYEHPCYSVARAFWKKVGKKLKVSAASDSGIPIESVIRIPLSIIGSPELSTYWGCNSKLKCPEKLNVSINWDAFYSYEILTKKNITLTNLDSKINSSSLEELSVEEIFQDKYESDEEFKVRRQSLFKGVSPMLVSHEMLFDYDFEAESLRLANRNKDFHLIINDQTSINKVSGANAFGAKWTWREKVGKQSKIVSRFFSETNLTKFLHLPANLVRQHKDDLTLIAIFKVNEQVPGHKIYTENPTYGDSTTIDNYEADIYQAKVTELQIGNRKTGEVIKSLKVKYGK